jgi:putative intracellular protease/amidase
MKVALLVAPKDFKDESVAQLKLMLGKWDVQAVITSYSTHDCVGYHGAVYAPQINSARITPDEFDALVLIDGKGVDSYKLYDFRPLLDTVKLFSMRNKMIASIGNATKIVARANVVSNVKVAMPSDDDARRLIILYHGTPSKEDVEYDKGILTLSNNDKILPFADLMLQKLGAK